MEIPISSLRIQNRIRCFLGSFVTLDLPRVLLVHDAEVPLPDFSLVNMPALTIILQLCHHQLELLPNHLGLIDLQGTLQLHGRGLPMSTHTEVVQD